MCTWKRLIHRKTCFWCHNSKFIIEFISGWFSPYKLLIFLIRNPEFFKLFNNKIKLYLMTHDRIFTKIYRKKSVLYISYKSSRLSLSQKRILTRPVKVIKGLSTIETSESMRPAVWSLADVKQLAINLSN